jgi:hypothetical protein
LAELVTMRAVALRGWNYPHVPRDEPPQGVTWLADGGIEASTDMWQYHEVWRMHPSGLFTHRWRLREDGTGFSGTLHVTAAIYTVAEIFEFGRRLYRDDETVTEVAFQIALQGVHGRPASGEMPDAWSGRAIRNEARHGVALPRADLAAGVLAPSVDAAAGLLGQLGFTGITAVFIEEVTSRFLSGRI